MARSDQRHLNRIFDKTPLKFFIELRQWACGCSLKPFRCSIFCPFEWSTLRFLFISISPSFKSTSAPRNLISPPSPPPATGLATSVQMVEANSAEMTVLFRTGKEPAEDGHRREVESSVAQINGINKINKWTVDGKYSCGHPRSCKQFRTLIQDFIYPENCQKFYLYLANTLQNVYAQATARESLSFHKMTEELSATAAAVSYGHIMRTAQVGWLTRTLSVGMKMKSQKAQANLS